MEIHNHKQIEDERNVKWLRKGRGWNLMSTERSSQYSASLIHCSTISLRPGFSMAAATLSLSFICLLTSPSILWAPSDTLMSSLKCPSQHCSNLIRRHRPMRVASEQWGTVGVNTILIHSSSSSSSSLLPSSSFFLDSVPGGRWGVKQWRLTVIQFSLTTFNSSRVWGCSGSLMSRIRSVKIESEVAHENRLMKQLTKYFSHDGVLLFRRGSTGRRMKCRSRVTESSLR